MTTSDAQTFARALYEALISTVLKQLRTAAPKLAEIGDDEPDLAGRITAALPPGAAPEIRNFLMTLAQEDRLDLLPTIIEAFADYSGAVTESDMLEAEVISAVPLSTAQQQHISDTLRKRYDRPLTIDFTVDESLIGGLIIRVGDQVLDNSLRVRLSAIQRNMLAS